MKSRRSLNFFIFLLSGLAHVGEELLILNAVVDELHKKAQQQGIDGQLGVFVLAEVLVGNVQKKPVYLIIDLRIAVFSYEEGLQQKRLNAGASLQLRDQGDVEKEDEAPAAVRRDELVHLSRRDEQKFAGIDMVRDLIDLHVIMVFHGHDDLHSGVPMSGIILILLIAPDPYGGIVVKLHDFLSVGDGSVAGPVAVHIIVINGSFVVLCISHFC